MLFRHSIPRWMLTTQGIGSIVGFAALGPTADQDFTNIFLRLLTGVEQVVGNTMLNIFRPLLYSVHVQYEYSVCPRS